MRYSSRILLALSLVALPLRGYAAESSDAGSAAPAAAPSMSMPATGNPSITTAPSEAREALLRQRSAAIDERESALRAVQEKSSFQKFVESATGTPLKVFGRELFGNVPSTYAPLGAVQVNLDYVIGPGDALQIRGWGMVDIDVNVTVNRGGEIYIPRVGSVKVAGVKYRDLQGYLKKAVGRIFTNFDLSASVSQTRSVQIYVVGHAQRPGTYTLSAMSSVLNALFTSGGPSATGTLRDIQLKRGTEPPVSIDLYDMLLYGDKSMDRSLQDGDVIFIPEVGPLVALLGNVKRPAIYELKKNTSLAEIVSWSGGFETASDLKNVIVEKGVDNRFQTVAELNADKASIEKELSKLTLNPSDIVRVIAPGSIPLQVKINRSFVRVDGAVANSGVFQLEKGETLKALITRIGGTTSQGYVFGTKLNRESLKAEQQQKIDESVDRYEKDIETNAKQRLAGQSDPAQAATLAAEVESQRNLLKKLRQVKAEGRIILNLKNADSQISDLPDFPLRDGDTVYIPERPSTVDVIGAVYQQNTIIYTANRKINDYLVLAGGVSPTGEKSEAYRICADGTVRSNRSGGLGGRVNPGDAIVVPEKIQRGQTFMQSLKDFTSVLYQFGLGAAGLATLKTL